MMTRPERILIPAGALAVSLAPLSVSAQQTFKQIVDGFFVPLGDLVVALLYALAFLFFLFGVVRYFFASGADAAEKRVQGKQAMLWGLIGLVVLFGVWGIINFLLSSLRAWA